MTFKHTHPADLFRALLDVENEDGKIIKEDLPGCTDKCLWELLDDDDPNEDVQMRGLLLLASKRIEELSKRVAFYEEGIEQIGALADNARRLSPAGVRP